MAPEHGPFLDIKERAVDGHAHGDWLFLLALHAGAHPQDGRRGAALPLRRGRGRRHAGRLALGKILAFITGYIVGTRDPVPRGVPAELSAAVKDLCAYYSTRPGQADADLVERLGLFEYLAQR